MTKRLIYADHAATTPLSDVAWEAMVPFLRGDFGNPSSLHSWAKKPKAAIAEARETIAKCIGAKSDEIYFTSGGTEANNWVINGSAGGLMISSYEHHSILNSVENARKKGRKVSLVNPSRNGSVLTRNISRSWQDGVGLVSVMTANNEIGVINPIKSLVNYVHKKGVLFHTDSVQSIGHIPIDVREMGVDFLSASAHKFNGPKGVGFLYMRKGLSLKPMIFGGQQEQGVRAGTENVAAIVGMAAALKSNCDEMERNVRHLNLLASQLKSGLEELCNGVYFFGSKSELQLPGFVSASFPGCSSEGIVHIMDLKGVAISAGAACDSKNTQLSHVLKAVKLSRKYAEGTVRITLGTENTDEDVKMILNAFKVALR